MMKTYITIIESKNPLVKQYNLDDQGQLIKSGTPLAYKSKARTCQCDTLEHMQYWLEYVGNSNNKALILGWIPGTETVGDYYIVPEKDMIEYRKQYGVTSGHVIIDGHYVTSRLKSNFRFSNWILLDRDNVEGMPSELQCKTPEEWWVKLSNAFPMFKNVGYVRTESASSRILINNIRPEVTNHHFFVRVTHSDDIDRFSKSFLIKSFSKGIGFMRPISTGGHRPWTLFDPTTFSPERIVYDGTPISLHPQIIPLPCQIHLNQGKDLYTNELSSATQNEMDELGLYIHKGSNNSLSMRNHKDLLPETLVEFQEHGIMSLKDYLKSYPGERARCQSPFRPDSVSFAAYVNFTEDGHPFLHDVGTTTSYYMVCNPCEKYGDLIQLAVDRQEARNTIQLTKQQIAKLCNTYNHLFKENEYESSNSIHETKSSTQQPKSEEIQSIFEKALEESKGNITSKELSTGLDGRTPFQSVAKEGELITEPLSNNSDIPGVKKSAHSHIKKGMSNDELKDMIDKSTVNITYDSLDERVDACVNVILHILYSNVDANRKMIRTGELGDMIGLMKNQYVTVLKNTKEEYQRELRNDNLMNNEIRHDLVFKHVSKDGETPLVTSDNLRTLMSGYGYHVKYNLITMDYDITTDNNIPFPVGNELTKLESDLKSLANIHNIKGESLVNNHLASVIQENTCNPVQDYYLSLPSYDKSIEDELYEGVNPLDYLVDNLNVTNKKWAKVALKRWLIQCCAAGDMIEHCGNSKASNKYEHVLVLFGEQGGGKTSFLRSLVPSSLDSYFNDGVILNISDKDSLIKATSSFISELGELDGTMTKSDSASLKAFLSNKIDKIRMPYAKTATNSRRHTSFCASVNHESFLKDTSGNRRFWPVKINGDLKLPEGFDIDVLWSYIWHLYINGEPWWFENGTEEYKMHKEVVVYHSFNDVQEALLTSFHFEQSNEDRPLLMTKTEVTKYVNMKNGTRYWNEQIDAGLTQLGVEYKRGDANKNIIYFKMPMRKPLENYETEHVPTSAPKPPTEPPPTEPPPTEPPPTEPPPTEPPPDSEVKTKVMLDFPEYSMIKEFN